MVSRAIQFVYAVSVVLPLILAACPAGAAAGPPARPALAALPIAEPVVLDGVLNDAVWQRVPAASGFIQREPAAGAAATEDTEIRVAYTPSALYIGIRALDSNPGAVVARAMQRDADVAEDDSVSIVLDTFDDRRNAYYFATNANGVRTDGLINDEGDDFTTDWNGLWRVKARRTEEGWTAEMEIPFSTLRFSPGKEAWGLNVRRMVRRKGEESYWASVPLEADITRISVAGRLTGLAGMSPGLNLRVKPFSVASGRESAAPAQKAKTGGGTATDSNTGLDVKWGVGRGLALDLTVNTDFAESEADEQQVNLSRFSLFLPERREFFLENAGIFEFGPRAVFGPPVLRPFFSRRVGLTADGRAVPIQWGTRLTGRSGPWSIGVLDAQTSAPEEGGGAADNWGALRLRRRIGERTSVGLLSTRHAAAGEENRVFGMDADFNLTSRLKLRSFWAQSDDTADGSGRTGGLGALYRGPLWRWSLDGTQIGERFDPEAGFLLRRGVRRYTGSLTFVPRPEIPHIRNLYFEGRSEVYTDLDGRLDWAWNGFDLFSFRTKKDDVVSLYGDARYERLAEPFEIRPGVVIPAAEHRFGDLGLWFETNSSRVISADGWRQQGTFYDGHRISEGLSLRLRPGSHFRSESSWEHQHAELPGGTFDTTLIRQRLALALTPDLSAVAFVQFNDAAELLSLNLRVNWIYRPGADIFLVVNDTWDAAGFGRRTQRDRQAILKVTYLFAL